MPRNPRAALAALAKKRARAKQRKPSSKPKLHHVRHNGLLPHPAFDLQTLPPSAWLTSYEVAQVLRKSLSTVRK